MYDYDELRWQERRTKRDPNGTDTQRTRADGEPWSACCERAIGDGVDGGAAVGDSAGGSVGPASSDPRGLAEVKKIECGFSPGPPFHGRDEERWECYRR